MDHSRQIYPRGFGPGDFGPGSGAGNPDPLQSANPPQQTIASVAQEPQSAQTMPSGSAPNNNPTQPSTGLSSATDISNVPASASVLSIGDASVTASSGSPSTTVGFQSSTPVSTLFNSASAPISTLFNSAAGNVGPGPSVVTSIIAMSTTTIAGLSNASASAAANGAEELTSETTGPAQQKNQTVIGVAVGICIWLLLIIAALSWCLWRQRKRHSTESVLWRRGKRSLQDDESARCDMSQSDVEAIMGMAPARSATAPILPPPAFLTRSASTMNLMAGPLESHPVSRNGRYSRDNRQEINSVSMFEYEILRSRLSATPRSLSTLFPGAQRISHYSDVTSLSSQTPKTHRSLVQTRALSNAFESEERMKPEPISALPPTLNNLNSWLQEHRRGSRMTASSSGVGMDFQPNNRDTYTDATRADIERGEEEDDRIKEPERMRADSGTLGTPIISSRAGPVSRPMSLASLKDVYRRSATLERSINRIGSVEERDETSVR